MSELVPGRIAERFHPVARRAPVTDGDPSLSNLAAMLRRQRFVLALCVLLVVLLAGAYTFWSRPTFEATSVLRFEKEQLNLPQLVQQVTTENRISTEIEVLQGRRAAEAVIDSLGLRAQLVSPRKGRVTRLFSTLRVAPSVDTATILFRVDGDSGYAVWQPGARAPAVWSPLGDTASAGGVTVALTRTAIGAGEVRLKIVSMDAAARAFAEALKVARPARDADLIDVGFTAADPELAARAANLIALHLIGERQGELQGRTGVAVNYLQEQMETLRTQLHVAEDTLRDYREAAGAVDTREQARTQVGRLSQLQADRGGLEAEQIALARLLGQIRAEAVAAPGGPSPYRRLIAFPTLLRNQAAAELLNSLAIAENDRSALLRRRTWQDPDVQMLSTRVDELDQQLQTIAETYLQGLSNQVAALGQVGRRFGRALDSLPGKEVTSTRLEREAEALQGMYSLVQTRLKEAEITQAMQDPTVRLADPAVAPERPIRPRPAVNLALSLVVGGLLGLGLSLGREVADRSVRSRGDALQAAGLPVLGAIPHVEARIAGAFRRLAGPRKRNGLGPNGWMSKGVESSNGNRTVAQLRARLVCRPETPRAYTESFNQLHANLALSHQERPLKVLVFTSPLPGEGKTLSAMNFALTAAARRLKVLLIDADLRCGVMNQVFGCAREPGLAELLAGSAQAVDSTRRIEVGDGVSLVFVPAGRVTATPDRVLSVERVKAALAGLAAHFDLVVIDSPPVNLLADAALLGAAADGVIVVVRAGKTEGDALRFAMDQLTAGRAPLLGTVLNDIDVRRYAYDDGASRYLAEAEKYHASHAAGTLS